MLRFRPCYRTASTKRSPPCTCTTLALSAKIRSNETAVFMRDADVLDWDELDDEAPKVCRHRETSEGFADRASALMVKFACSLPMGTKKNKHFMPAFFSTVKPKTSCLCIFSHMLRERRKANQGIRTSSTPVVEFLRHRCVHSHTLPQRGNSHRVSQGFRTLGTVT